MQVAPMAETGLYMVAAAVLAAAALHDLRERRIPNALSLILTGLFVPIAALEALTGADFMTAFGWPLIIAAVVLVAGLTLFATGLMGGGDVKLLAAIALIAGADYSLRLVLYTALAGGLVAFATLAHARLKGKPARDAEVPYGIAIAFSGCWVCFAKIVALHA